MPLFAQIDEDIIKALKAGEKEKLTVLRGLKSDLKYKQIELGKELTDDDCIAVLTSALKKRKDSIEQFKSGNRDDLVKQEEIAVEIITPYLPEQISEEELTQIIKDAIAESGADSPQKIGLIMKIVIPKVKGQADGKMINQIAVKLLSN
ncbi:MAG: GatB/YqeY domain-containing protein [Calditrichaeota bacterium]|nr:MAG: GatB/YqeY domain-containing protein [Calditrichota bacterium]